MGAAATFSTTALAVEPGGETTFDLTVRNIGTVVDQFTFEAHGAAREWITIDPPSVSLLPGTEGTATVRITPPRSPSVPAGPVPFGVRVVSSEDPQGSIVEEGTLEVGRFSDVAGELLPRTARGRRGAEYEVAFDNRGNGRVNASLMATDPDELLVFALQPPGFVSEPGTATFSKLKVTAKKRFWRGPAQTHPFQVLVQPDHDEPVALEGTFLQEALLPKWLWKAIALALLAILALVLLWFTVLRPTVENAAREAAEEAAEEAVAEQAAAVEEAAQTAAAAQETAEAAQAAAEGGANQATLDEEAREAARAAVQARVEDLGEPFDFRLTRSVAPGASASEPFTVPDDQVLSLTDIVVQNPGGDQGVLRILRDPGGDDPERTLIEVRLENFRDLDYHFVSPVVFTGGQVVLLSVTCENDGDQACNAGAYFNGFTKTVEEPDAQQ